MASFLGRFLYLAVGLALTVVVGTLLIQTRFPHAGWAPAPFVGVDYSFGAGIFLVVNALFRTKSLLRVAAFVAATCTVGLLFGAFGARFLFWLVAIPSAGAVAATIWLPWPVADHPLTEAGSPAGHPDRHSARTHKTV
jgi:hypothetical protein